PANKSRHRAPTTSCCNQLNKVSRTRSGVGLRPGISGKLMRRPRQPPPMMRTELRPPAACDSVLGVVTAGMIPANDERYRPLAALRVFQAPASQIESGAGLAHGRSHRALAGAQDR